MDFADTDSTRVKLKIRSWAEDQSKLRSLKETIDQ